MPAFKVTSDLNQDFSLNNFWVEFAAKSSEGKFTPVPPETKQWNTAKVTLGPTTMSASLYVKKGNTESWITQTYYNFAQGSSGTGMYSLRDTYHTMYPIVCTFRWVKISFGGSIKGLGNIF